jgi:hypothetical protein
MMSTLTADQAAMPTTDYLTSACPLVNLAELDAYCISHADAAQLILYLERRTPGITRLVLHLIESPIRALIQAQPQEQ